MARSIRRSVLASARRHCPLFFGTSATLQFLQRSDHHDAAATTATIAYQTTDPTQFPLRRNGSSQPGRAYLIAWSDRQGMEAGVRGEFAAHLRGRVDLCGMRTAGRDIGDWAPELALGSISCTPNRRGPRGCK
jgi:hypothetical protein